MLSCSTNVRSQMTPKFIHFRVLWHGYGVTGVARVHVRAHIYTKGGLICIPGRAHMYIACAYVYVRACARMCIYLIMIMRWLHDHEPVPWSPRGARRFGKPLACCPCALLLVDVAGRLPLCRTLQGTSIRSMHMHMFLSSRRLFA